MRDKNCIFCRIASGEAPAYKIYEDIDYLAFLDVFPNIEGQALIIPKKHMCSLFSEIDDRELTSFMLAAKKVANLMRKKMKVARVHLVLEGTGICHLHAKLYPSSGLAPSRFKEVVAAERIYFKRYPGYVTTMMGPRASDAALERVRKKIVR